MALRRFRPSFRAFAARILFAIACGLAPTAIASAQCELRPNGSVGIPGANGAVLAMRSWDPDGAGPRLPVVVVGGEFTLFGPTPCSGIATYEPVTRTFGTLGDPAVRLVRAITVAPNGDLLIASRVGFDDVVERWNGTQWTRLGGPFGDRLYAIVGCRNGDVLVGGERVPNGVPGGFVSRWNGTSWQQLGSNANGLILALAELASGDVVAGGNFAAIGGVPSPNLARFTGGAWVPFGQPNTSVLSMFERSNGELVIGGTFVSVGGVQASGLAVWNGTSWYGLSVSAPVHTILEDGNGDLVVGGEFLAPPVRIGRWDGTAWTSLGRGLNGVVRAIAFAADGSMVAGGTITNGSGTPLLGVAHSSQGLWEPVVDGIAGSMYAVAAHPAGGLVLSYTLPSTSGQGQPQLARFDGTSFSTYATGIPFVLPPMLVMSNGDVIGRDSQQRLLRVTPTTYGLLQPPLAAVLDMELDAQQRLVVCGYETGFTSSSVHRLDPSGWVRLGAPFPGTLSALAQMENGDLVVGGTFPDVGGAPIARIARWTGSAFASLGSGVNGPVTDLVKAPDGRLLVVGSFTEAGSATANGSAWWDGSSWVREPAFENVVLRRPLFLPDGSLVHRPWQGSQRWDGAQWTNLGDSLVYLDDTYGSTAVLQNGDYAVAGLYYGSPAPQSFPLLIYGSSCRASASIAGSGCQGASLRAPNAAWIGGVCRVRGEGLGSAQLAVVVTGFQSAAIGLDTLLQQGVAGCTLQVVEDAGLTHVAYAQGGIAQHSLSIPRDPVFVGVAFRQQMVPAQFDAQGAITAITSTNAIDHVVGSY